MMGIDGQEEVETPKDSIFPRERMRKGQFEFYKDIRDVIKEEEILLADAPTGIGKTAASLSAMLESTIAEGRKTIFLTNRNSHHLQAIIEVREIMEKRKKRVYALREDMIGIRVVDKISKDRMCLRLFGKRDKRPPFLLCEIARCQYQNAKQEHARLILDTPMSAIELGTLGAQEGFCAHQNAIMAAKEADLIICDYSYLFSPMISQIMLDRMGLRLSECDVIIDEAHNLPKRVRDINERRVDQDSVKKAIRGINQIRKIAVEQEDQTIADLASLCARHVRIEISAQMTAIAYDEGKKVGEIKIDRDRLAFLRQRVVRVGDDLDKLQLTMLIDQLCDYFSTATLKSRLDDIDYDAVSSLRELLAFLIPAEEYAWGNKRWGVFFRRVDEQSYIFRAILYDPSEVSRAVFEQVHSAVLMSGTLNAKESICDLLGIRRAVGLDRGRYESPFDKRRQPIFVCTGASSRFRDRGDDRKLEKMVGLIEQAAASCGSHSFAIYYPSYEFMEMVLSRLRLEGYEIEKEDKGEDGGSYLDRKSRFAKNRKKICFNAVIGAKYNEGVDFRNNPFKLIVIAGFPYPKKNASHIEYERYITESLGNKNKAEDYCSILPAIDSVLQTIGRGIRQKEDWCACLLIDDRYVKYRAKLPSSIRERAELVDAGRVGDAIRGFVQEMEEG